jgi:hypothetical protein
MVTGPSHDQVTRPHCPFARTITLVYYLDVTAKFVRDNLDSLDHREVIRVFCISQHLELEEIMEECRIFTWLIYCIPLSCFLVLENSCSLLMLHCGAISFFNGLFFCQLFEWSQVQIHRVQNRDYLRRRYIIFIA